MENDSGPKNGQARQTDDSTGSPSRTSVYSDETNIENRYRRGGSGSGTGRQPRRRQSAAAEKRPPVKKKRRASRKRSLLRTLWLLVLLVAIVLAWIYLRNLDRRLSQTSVEQDVTSSSVSVEPGETEFAQAVRELLQSAMETRRHLQVAEDLTENGLHREAMDYLQELLANGYRQYELQLALAEVYRREQRPAAAAELLLGILSEIPFHLPARSSLLDMLLQQGHDETALEVARWILADDPSNAKARQAANRLSRR